jgi:ABC-2 type transport system ATP-binding protein
MTSPQGIEAVGLSKRYGAKTVVHDLSFTVRPGSVTGFLGPNGAGKSTTMRMLLGLDAPTRGTSTVGGRAYAGHTAPLTEVGALLEAKSVHPGRSARNHLLALAHTHGIPASRVDQVVELTGLTDVARRRVKGFSLGMGQRLGIAAALLGDPATLVLDEPVNGLDPEGVLWIRTLLKSLAAEGRTVLVSSHLMSEMALTADHLVIVGRGRLLADTTVEAFVRSSGTDAVKVVSPEASALAALLAGPGVEISSGTPGELRVRGTDGEHIGRTAAAHGIPLYELTPLTASLEQAFMDLTRDEVEYQAAVAPASAPLEGAAA